MSIKETVKQALAQVSGNKPFTSEMLAVEINNQPIDYPGSMQCDQIRRALRDIKYVRRVNGRYIAKGRRVPAPPTVKASHQCKRCKKLHRVDDNGKSALNSDQLCKRCVERCENRLKELAQHAAYIDGVSARIDRILNTVDLDWADDGSDPAGKIDITVDENAAQMRQNAA